MVSPTTRVETIRRRKRTTSGKANKRHSLKVGTPKFPVHPEGYDPKAADAKPVEAPAEKKA
jgi:hypothetical protein